MACSEKGPLGRRPKCLLAGPQDQSDPVVLGGCKCVRPVVVECQVSGELGVQSLLWRGSEGPHVGPHRWTPPQASGGVSEVVLDSSHPWSFRYLGGPGVGSHGW